jgi:hypothetical protein
MTPPDRRAAPTRSIADAIDGSAPLARLLAQVEASRRAMAVIAPRLPPALRERVRAGPVDAAQGLVLLAEGPAAAAKLRHLLPELAAALAEAGSSVTALVVKVAPPAGAPAVEAPTRRPRAT